MCYNPSCSLIYEHTPSFKVCTSAIMIYSKHLYIQCYVSFLKLEYSFFSPFHPLIFTIQYKKLHIKINTKLWGFSTAGDEEQHRERPALEQTVGFACRKKPPSNTWYSSSSFFPPSSHRDICPSASRGRVPRVESFHSKWRLRPFSRRSSGCLDMFMRGKASIFM